MEALVRWNNPGLGFAAPDEFIPLAESDRAIVPIGDWILETSMAQLDRWRATTYPELALAINVAPEKLC